MQKALIKKLAHFICLSREHYEEHKIGYIQGYARAILDDVEDIEIKLKIPHTKERAKNITTALKIISKVEKFDNDKESEVSTILSKFIYDYAINEDTKPLLDFLDFIKSIDKEITNNGAEDNEEKEIIKQLRKEK